MCPGFVGEMRAVAMKLHTREQAPKEGGTEAPKRAQAVRMNSLLAFVAMSLPCVDQACLNMVPAAIGQPPPAVEDSNCYHQQLRTAVYRPRQQQMLQSLILHTLLFIQPLILSFLLRKGSTR